MSKLTNHPLRYTLSNELHARPFPQVDAPSTAVFLALSESSELREEHNAHLTKLLDRFGAPHGTPNASHYIIDLGNMILKWERHSEFVSYMLIRTDTDTFDGPIELETVFPKDWLDASPGLVMTAASVRVHKPQGLKSVEKSVLTGLHDYYSPESLSVSYVLNKSAAIITDFRTDAKDMVRFEVLPIGQVGRSRLGRIVQRLFEIETYKQMAMLGLPVAQSVFAALTKTETELAIAVNGLAHDDGTSKETLDQILGLSARIEELLAKHTYRFGATEAYGALALQRIEILREETLMERQTFAEFMMRRFTPALRTSAAAQKRLSDISSRAARAADLLGTRVGVQLDAQNQMVLTRMDERAGIHLRLQETVEGLSVVAISYYAVQLLAALTAPIANQLFGMDKTLVTGLLVIPVITLVALALRRVRKRLEKTHST